MKIEKWQKVVLSIGLVYIAVAMIVLTNRDICTSMFFTSFCSLDSRYLWGLGPVILLILLAILWGKELAAHSKKVKFTAMAIFFILIVAVLGCSLQTAFFPDRCNNATAKEFIFSKLERVRGKNWNLGLGMSKNEFFHRTFEDVYDTGRKTLYGYRVCHVKNKIFQFGEGAQELYYYYDPNTGNYVEY